jgi:predicted PurR-regulated permease PerM
VNTQPSTYFSVSSRVLLTLAALVVVVAGMRVAEPIITPFLLALFITTIVAPPMFSLQRRGIPKGVAMFLVLTVFLVLGALLIVLVGNSVNDFATRLPDYQQRLKGYLDGAGAFLENLGIPLSRNMLDDFVDPSKAMGLFATTLKGLGGVLSNAFLIFFTVVFLLLEANGFSAKLRASLGDPEKSYPRFVYFSESLQQYLVIKGVTSLVTAVMVAVPLAIMGLDFALLWGVLMFILNYIPNIGPIIAAVPAVLLGLVQLGFFPALLVAGVYLAANTIMGNIVEPRLMGRGVGLSTLVVFLSLVFWGWVLGPVGMLLSVPLTMAVKIALESSEDSRGIAVLLGNFDGARSQEASKADFC